MEAGQLQQRINLKNESKMSHITSIEQFHRLQSIVGTDSVNLYSITTNEYIKSKGLEASKLTIDHFFALGVPLRDTSSGGWNRITIKENDVENFKLLLSQFISQIQKRIEWLMSGSYRVFGHVSGKNVCILVDCSEMNFYGDREELLKNALQILMSEQLSQMKVQFLALNQKVNSCWNKPTFLGDFQKKEIIAWIDTIQPQDGCNLLNALRICSKEPTIDTICIVLGSKPDQDADTIIDFVREKFVGTDINIHTIDFNSKSYETKMLLKELAKEMDGRHHSYTDDLNSDLMNSTDTFLLSQELKQALIILSQVEELINGGSIKNTLLTVKKNPKESRRLVMAVESKEKQRLRNEYEQLNMDLLSTELHSSADWLKLQGLKAKGLTLYQVMAPNAYSYVKGYVPSLAKNVKSRVHHQSMVQMEWHDGSLKNVHIDPVLLFSYQHHLQNALQVFERRVHWLQGASRRYYGCIVQKRVIFLVDLSTCMQYGLGELQLSLKQLMEEQIGHDMTFNMLW